MAPLNPIPRPDPVPLARPSLKRRFWRIVRLLAFFATVVAGIAVAVVARGSNGDAGGIHIHMLIATALGVWFTIMIGAVLMTLVFISASSGHDSQASRTPDERIDRE